MNYATVAEEFSATKRQAEKILAELLKLEMISRCEFQYHKKMVCYQTTIKGNALGMAKAGKPVTRASADEVLREFLDRVSNRRPVAVRGLLPDDALRLRDRQCVHGAAHFRDSRVR